MTLRARLFAGLLVVLATLAVGGSAVVARQRAFLVGQLDERLLLVTTDAQRIVNRLAARGDNFPGASALSEVYVGVLEPNGQLTNLLAPTNDPQLVPQLSSTRRLGQPFSAGSVQGGAKQVRVVEVALRRRERTAVFAVSTAEADAAFRQLIVGGGTAIVALGLVLGLVALWIVRLGLSPIQRMTEAADAIALGDTTRRVQAFPAGTEAARLGRAMNLMVDTNQSAESRLRRFVADASHELRTPLTTLRGYASLYQAGGFSDKAQLDDAMRRIMSEANRMSVLVDDLLLLAALDEGRPMERSSVDIVKILRGMAADMAVVQPARPIRLLLPETAVVQGDEARLTQVFAAITNNAMMHTPETVGVEIRLVAQPAIRVEIIDQGPGIPEADLDRVFERFYRADRGRSRAVGGSGLGLAIVTAIVEAHGGSVGVTSGPRRGTTFWVTFPPYVKGGPLPQAGTIG